MSFTSPDRPLGSVVRILRRPADPRHECDRNSSSDRDQYTARGVPSGVGSKDSGTAASLIKYGIESPGDRELHWAPILPGEWLDFFRRREIVSATHGTLRVGVVPEKLIEGDLTKIERDTLHRLTTLTTARRRE